LSPVAKSKRNTHGGARPGAGRRPKLPEGARPRAIRLTDAEYRQVCDFLKKIRTAKAAETPEKQAI
jgi:hypothetical protein